MFVVIIGKFMLFMVFLLFYIDFVVYFFVVEIDFWSDYVLLVDL